MYHTVLRVTCDLTYVEILMAEIGEAGFDTFLENDHGFEAYAEADHYDSEKVDRLREKYNTVNPLNFEWDRIEKRNWNEEWEKSYEPIIVDDRCLIRAHFHQIEKKYPYEIIITPKMSFGTGHHQTTYLMIKNQMAVDHQGKTVMDAGCGTGILSIMASKLGAKRVEAFDIDDWSVVNGRENIELNQCEHINLRQGKISDLTFDGSFDIILANINKNTLLQELPQYAAYLNDNGLLLLSGFLQPDEGELIARASDYQLQPMSRDSRENWACLLLQKVRK